MAWILRQRTPIRGDQLAFQLPSQDDERSVIGRNLLAEAERERLEKKRVGDFDDLEREVDQLALKACASASVRPSR